MLAFDLLKGGGSQIMFSEKIAMEQGISASDSVDNNVACSLAFTGSDTSLSLFVAERGRLMLYRTHAVKLATYTSDTDLTREDEVEALKRSVHGKCYL